MIKKKVYNYVRGNFNTFKLRKKCFGLNEMRSIEKKKFHRLP